MTALDKPVPVADPDPDPEPQPPREPDLDDCCGSGCNPCIFDLHEMAMDLYRERLQAWRERHPQGQVPPEEAASS